MPQALFPPKKCDPGILGNMPFLNIIIFGPCSSILRSPTPSHPPHRTTPLPTQVTRTVAATTAPGTVMTKAGVSRRNLYIVPLSLFCKDARNPPALRAVFYLGFPLYLDPKDPKIPVLRAGLYLGVPLYLGPKRN